MHTLYTASAGSTNKAVMGEWDSINNYETLQFEIYKKRYPEYFGCLYPKNSATDFDHSLIRENDKRRLRLSRQEVEELLDLENGMQENYLVNNHSNKFEDLKYFKPISPLIQKKIIHEKMKTDENRKIKVKSPIFISENNLSKPIKPKPVFDNQKLKNAERTIKDMKIKQKIEELSTKEKNRRKSPVLKDVSSESFSTVSNEDQKKKSLNDIFLNFFLMNSFLTLDKNGCFKLTQEESYRLFKAINKALKLGKSKQEIRNFINNFERDDQNFLSFNNFENTIVNSLLNNEEKFSRECKKQRSPVLPETEENEELNNFDMSKEKNKNNRSIGYKIAFVNLFLANALASLDMRSEYRISKKGAFDVLLTLNKLMEERFSEKDLRKFIGSFDEKNDDFIDFSEFKKSVVQMVTN
jgi:hypothetical protein